MEGGKHGRGREIKPLPGIGADFHGRSKAVDSRAMKMHGLHSESGSEHLGGRPPFPAGGPDPALAADREASGGEAGGAGDRSGKYRAVAEVGPLASGAAG